MVAELNKFAVYTRPAPKSQAAAASLAAPIPVTPAPEPAIDVDHPPSYTGAPQPEALVPAPIAPTPHSEATAPITLPLNSIKKEDSAPSTGPSPLASSTILPSDNSNQDSKVLHDTINVIDEHITDLRSPPSTGALRAPATDSGSEYSSHLDHRASYIQGEETDEEEEATHTRAEVQAWSSDQVAEYLFTAGVEKQHCEVFRDQEITGEVLLGMDQSSLFIKAFDLGSVGKRLKTWQKIKSLQDQVNSSTNLARRTQAYGSEAGSDGAKKGRSRTSTLTSSVARPSVDRPSSVQAKRLSLSRTPRMEPAPLVSPVSPRALDSPSRPSHTKRPSAASVRDLHHSRRHSSNDHRLTGTTVNNTGTPKLVTNGTFPQTDGTHKKQPSFDRNWTLGGAYTQRPLSSAGLNDIMQQHSLETQDPVDADRGYFSGTDADGRRRNVLKKRDSGAHSRKNSYADEQRVRSATAISRHSRYGSIESREGVPSPAAQKYYGIQNTTHKRTNSTSTSHSVRRVPSNKEGPPSVTRIDSSLRESLRESPITPSSPTTRPGISPDWLNSMVNKPTVKIGGLRAISDTAAGDRLRITAPAEGPRESPLQSPARTQSSTPSAGPSFDFDSPDAAKSPSTAATTASKTSRKKGKKETSAYQRGLQKISPQEAVKNADYSGWMKKKSSNLMTTWKPRLFVLKGRRLAYYYSEDDTQEKGLIDISFHRVLPADNEKLTGLHATLTGAGSTAAPATSVLPGSNEPLDKGDDAMFIFKLVPPRAGLSRAVTFTKPTVHYFAVPNLQQGRLWMAALVKATIDRDDSQPITTTYQQKTISLAKARAMRHRPPALMNLDEGPEDDRKLSQESKQDANLLGIHFGGENNGVDGLDDIGFPKAESANPQKLAFDNDNGVLPPQSA